MKVIILAGGFGTRLGEYTDLIPKPMVQIGEKPIIWHVMNIYSHFGFSDFILALGYKAEIIKDYFLNFRTLNSDFTINLKTGEYIPLNNSEINWRVSLIDTGLKSMTGGRLLKIKKFLNNEAFMLTYGDGVANININELIRFHRSHGKMVTITAVRPNARFGELNIEDNKVINFQEKPQMTQGWINGGFFVIEPSFLDLIEDESTVLEGHPLELAAKMGELMAFYHSGFWQCMDTKRDKDYLEELTKNNVVPWNIF
jgi:glucose-1-phosphate cytidylyltransferase